MSSSARLDNLIHNADMMSCFLGSVGSFIDKVRQSDSFADIVSWQKCNLPFGYQNIQKLDNDMITKGVDNELVT